MVVFDPISISTTQDMHAFGRSLATLLQASDCLVLSGELGAGKTTLVQGLAWGLGLSEKEYARSPSYSIACSYPTKPILHHLDWYRLDEQKGQVQVEELLGDTYWDKESITVIEWGMRAKQALPKEYYHLAIVFSAASPIRQITLSASSKELELRLIKWQLQQANKLGTSQ